MAGSVSDQLDDLSGEAHFPAVKISFGKKELP